MTQYSNKAGSLVRRLVLVFAMVLALACLLANTAKAKNVYTIKADANVYTVESFSADGSSSAVDEALDEAGVELSATDKVDVEETEDESDPDATVKVSVTHAQYATLTVDGTLTSVLLQEGDTVKDVINRLNIKLGKNDIVSMKLSDKVDGGDSIVINRVEITYFDKVKTSDFDTARVADPDSYIGTEYIKQEGVPGKVVRTYEKKVIDGGEPIITEVKKEVTEMVTEVTAYGTRVDSPSPSGLSASRNVITNIDKEQGTITLSDGSTYGYSSVSDSFSATAYSGGGTTSTGRAAQIGVVAVDPSVIPYGTRMYITSGSIVYGVCVAGDCGVHGHLIDLYFNSASHCRSFGRRGITVYFLN